MRASTVWESIRDRFIKLNLAHADQKKVNRLTNFYSPQQLKHTAFCYQIKVDRKHMTFIHKLDIRLYDILCFVPQIFQIYS